ADAQPRRPRLMADGTDILFEELLGDLDMDAGAVAGLAVSIDRAAVPERLQRLDGQFDDLASWLAVARRDQPYAARIMLLRRIGEPVPFEIVGIATKGSGTLLGMASLLAHRPSPSGCGGERRARRGHQVALDRGGCIPSVANGPHHQCRPAHDVAGG